MTLETTHRRFLMNEAYLELRKSAVAVDYSFFEGLRAQIYQMIDLMTDDYFSYEFGLVPTLSMINHFKAIFEEKRIQITKRLESQPENIRSVFENDSSILAETLKRQPVKGENLRLFLHDLFTETVKWMELVTYWIARLIYLSQSGGKS